MNLDFSSARSRWAGALSLPVAIVAIVAIAPPLQAQNDEDENYMGENPDRYAQVKVLEGEVNILKGEIDEPLSRGTPVAEGDVVESHGRGVLQLADGSRIAFGADTRFQVSALFMDRDQERQVLLRLEHGRLRVFMGRESEARIRVDTPSGTGTLSDTCSATFEVDPDRTVRVRVYTGRLAFANERGRTFIPAGDRLTVYSNQDQLDRIRGFSTFDNDSFDEWCDRSAMPRRGASWERVPPEIRYYSDDLDGHGEWVYVDDCNTWCWRPKGVVEEWRPYWRGRWGCYAGGMTWVSDEPWGYVTHHFGRWGWGVNLGWYWIPGAYYSPAWVAWQTNDAYFGWAPMGYSNRPCSWGYGAWHGGYCWNVVQVNQINVYNIHTRVYNDGGVIRRFTPGTGDTGWTRGPQGNRPLTPAWRQGPVLVNREEFRDPGRFQRAVQDRPLARDRMRTYEQQATTSTGRTIFRDRRPLQVAPAAPTGTNLERPRDPRPAPFEDRSRLHQPNERPIFRSDAPRNAPPPPNHSDSVRPLTGQPSRTGPATLQERPRPEQPHVDQPRAEQPRSLQPPTERPRVEQPHAQPSPEQPHTVQPRPEQPHVEQPRPHPEQPRNNIAPIPPRTAPPSQPHSEAPPSRPREDPPREERKPEPRREPPRSESPRSAPHSEPPPPIILKKRPLERP